VKLTASHVATEPGAATGDNGSEQDHEGEPLESLLEISFRQHDFERSLAE